MDVNQTKRRENAYSDMQKLDLDEDVKIIDFIYAVVQVLDILIKTYGIIGFKKC
ncbi:hypothetical protein [Paenibacillus agricola]|uniref:Uncharacterized protein n=1 Tax=Paenibacillus agricola TaxID=2716264 RepID=A0ABX0JFH5_9BACL|nr:hypothetical protein [Paenibacillus agricola]NHN34521.1 hypothetical protein [Paenibacillus agricola]